MLRHAIGNEALIDATEIAPKPIQFEAIEGGKISQNRTVQVYNPSVRRSGKPKMEIPF
jgi:hypothetical protein